MFRSIRLRLIAVLALPIALLLAVAIAQLSTQAANEERAEDTQSVVVEEVRIAAIAEAIQQERAVALGWNTEMTSSEAQEATAAALESLGEVDDLADAVSAARAGVATWGDAIAAAYDVEFSRATASNAGVDRGLRSARLLAAIEEGYLTQAELLADNDATAIANNRVAIDANVELYRLLTDADRRGAIDAILASEAAINVALGEGGAQQAAAIAGAVRVGDDIDQLRATSLNEAQFIVDAAVDRAGDRRGLFALFGILGGLTLLGITYVAHKSVMDPLERLTAEARAVANESLPEMVDGLSRLGAEDVAIELNPVTETTSEEIGELVDAFNGVHDQAVNLALTQARARRNIGEFFVTVGRRNQRLLERQLRLIGELEEQTNDPTVMKKVFELDHVSARMRRNSESLLVLAGAESPRQWRNPIAADVIAQAVLAEVDDFDRVVSRLPRNVEVLGNAVADVTHLLAEIVENALSFSDPATQVQLNAEMADDDLIVSVTDSGIGMSQEELDTFNRIVRSVDPLDLMDARRLGTQLITGLARRHKIAVTAVPAVPRGLSVRVTLPAEILEVKAPLQLIPDEQADDEDIAPVEPIGNIDVEQLTEASAPVIAEPVEHEAAPIVEEPEAVAPEVTADTTEPDPAPIAETATAAPVAEPVAEEATPDAEPEPVAEEATPDAEPEPQDTVPDRPSRATDIFSFFESAPAVEEEPDATAETVGPGPEAEPVAAAPTTSVAAEPALTNDGLPARRPSPSTTSPAEPPVESASVLESTTEEPTPVHAPAADPNDIFSFFGGGAKTPENEPTDSSLAAEKEQLPSRKPTQGNDYSQGDPR